MIDNYIFNIIAGDRYFCDRCESTGESHNEVDYAGWYLRTKDNFHYCKPCWNYMNLRRGYCPKCQSRSTGRGKEDKMLKSCGCGNMVELT